MANNHQEDILIDTIHQLRAVLDKCLDEINTADGTDLNETVINKVEKELHNLNLETNKIYIKMIADALESKETKEMIESKKGSTSEGV